MAVENKYVNTNVAADKLEATVFVHGDKMICMLQTFETAAADDDLSVYRLWKNVPADLIPVKIEIACDAITGGTDWDLGFYEPSVGGVDGAVIDREVLANTLDLSSAVAWSSALDGLENLNISEVNQRIYEICGHTLATKKRGYDIALTAVTVGSGVGTVSVRAWFVQG